MVWQRARSEQQKEQRRAVLLETAARMLETRGLEQLSLNAIAREANISKANVYRYFESREELLLHLALEALQRWASTLCARLDRLAPGDARAVARTLTGAVLEHPRFAHLSAVLSTVLEHNVSTDVIVWFKTAFLARVAELVQAVQQALPELERAQALQLLQTCYFTMVGMWPAAHPPPAVQAALERPELEAACVDFEADFERVLLTTIFGLRATPSAPR